MYLEGRGVVKNHDLALELFAMTTDQIPQAHDYAGVCIHTYIRTYVYPY